MSLRALAHTAPAAVPFNANFFIVAATVIPVLYLAIAVQGRAYENLLSAAVAADEKATRAQRTGKTLAGLRPAITWLLLTMIALVIPLLGVGGEFTAISALLYQQAGTGAQGFVASAVIYLTIITAAGPTATAWRTLNARRPTTTGREREALPETGKTDSEV